MSDNSTTVVEEAAPYIPTFDSNQYIMIMGLFVALILGFDLMKSLEHISNAKQNRRLKIIFGLLLFFYVSEMFLTMGNVISALCPVALWLLGICHYSIKVIVSYSYCTRITIAMKGSMAFSSGGIKTTLSVLQGVILCTMAANLFKVFMFYSSTRDGDACNFDLGGFWMYLDEIMFGAIDLFTLGLLFMFYFKVELNDATSTVVKRILYMSSVTMVATVFAVWVNVADPPIGLSASILDISTDCITLMKVYTLPRKPKTKSSSSSQGFSRVASSSRMSRTGSDEMSLVKKDRKEGISLKSIKADTA